MTDLSDQQPKGWYPGMPSPNPAGRPKGNTDRKAKLQVYKRRIVAYPIPDPGPFPQPGVGRWCFFVGKSWEAIAEMWADQPLQAAAPDLLACLRRVLTVGNNPDLSVAKNRDQFDTAIADAWVAIAKAEGLVSDQSEEANRPPRTSQQEAAPTVVTEVHPKSDITLELLEALKDVLKLHGVLYESEPLAPAYGRANAAVRKAEGRS